MNKSKEAEKAIKVCNLYKSFDNLTVLNDVCFQVNKGEIFGILGPNGAGKTTLMEIMEGLQNKSKGKIYINGLDMDVKVHKTKMKKKIGVQLQSSGFIPTLKLKEIVGLFAALYQISVVPRQALEAYGLDKKAHLQYQKLSGGEKKRLALCVALLHEPEIIFLDEPSSSLDPSSRRKLWGDIQGVAKKGKTILITTHYMEEAEILCNRVAFINKGKLLKIASPKHFIEDLIAKGFKKKPIASPQANLDDVFLDLTGENLIQDPSASAL